MSSRPTSDRLLRGANVVALALLFLSFLGVGAFLGAYERIRSTLPSIARLEDWQPSLITKVYSRDGEVIAEFASERREIVPLERIPDHFIEAILATEDRSFYDHDGINLRRVVSVAIPYLLEGSKRQGASTITMQLSRNLFLTPEKALVRKIREMVLAHEIEHLYPKERILEMYANQVYFGSGAYGIESAAQGYFGKSASELTLPEAALLAGIVQSPSRQSPRVDMDAAMARRAVVLDNMVEVGVLDRETARATATMPIELAARRARTGADSYFTEHVRRELERMLGTDAVWTEGYRVYTTLDSRLQEEAERVVEEHALAIERTLAPDKTRRETWLAERATADSLDTARDDPDAENESSEDTRTPYLQSALVSIDLDTGGIVAMVGGRDFEESKFNRITQGRRQPGSVFKPFVYTAAIRNGFPASYVVEDESISMETGDGEIWEPQNFDRTFRGPVTLRHGLTHSTNIAAIKTMFAVGTQAVIDYARDAGVTTPLPAVHALALGAAELIPIEAARAYTIYPTGGVRITPIPITRIEDHRGNVVREFEAPRTRVLTPQEAHIVRTILEDVVDYGTGRYGIRGRGFEWPAAGKTGTTNESTDAWFVGFTPEFLTLTWVGFDRKQRIRYNGTGGVLAAPIWTDFMKVAHGEIEIPEDPFPEPPGLEHEVVTTTTGMLAAPFCGMPSYEEIFVPGTVPEHYCHPADDGEGVPLLEPPTNGPREEPDGEGETEEEEVGDDFMF